MLTTVTVATNASSYKNQWVRLNTWTNPKAGQYYVRVLTNASGTETTNSRGSNGFGLRAFTGSSFATCSTITGSANYSATCPQVHAVSDMSIFANLSGTTADFYLAQIDPIHAGQDDAHQPVRRRRGREQPPDSRSERQPVDVLLEYAVQPTDRRRKVARVVAAE